MKQDFLKVVPQIKTYVDHGTAMMPYVIRTAQPGFRSDVVNTDDYGYRFSYDAEGIVDSHTWWRRRRKGLVIGNSFVFGYGASCDRKSPVSILNTFSNYSFLNLGIPAGNSTQEFIAAVPFLQYTEYVLVCSGMVNLNLNLQSIGRYKLYGPFAGEPLFAKLSRIEFRKLDSFLQGDYEPGTGNDRDRELPGPVGVEAGMPRDEIEARFARAVYLQSRDLKLIVRACKPSTPVFFAFQPLAVLKPRLTPEEKESIRYDRSSDSTWWKVSDAYSGLMWPRYIYALERMCADIGVPFVDLNELDLDGRYFIDYSHMTDWGYRKIMQYLAGWMKGMV